jgi:hypothetical protein
MKKIKKNLANKGITLIALVISIIVILMLAGVSLSATVGDNGIITKAQSAKIENEKASVKESLSMAVAAATANANGRLDINSLEEELNKLDGITVAKDGEDGQLPWTVTGSGMKFQIKEDGTVEEINGIILSKELLKMVEGQSPVTITATLTYGVQGTVTWTSSNESIATVNNGTITLVGTSGIADITATISGTGYSATCKVTVVSNVTNATVDSDASVETGATLDITSIITNISSIEEFTIASVTGNAEKINDTTIKGTGTTDGAATVTIKGTSSEATKVITVIVKQAVQPAVGDFVNYSAGTWDTTSIAKITASGAKKAPETTANTKPSSSYQFGGFVVGGSRDGNATPYSSSYNYVKDSSNNAVTGWRIFDISDTGEITLISAGCPEDFYHPYGTNCAYISEYILTGNINSSVSTDTATSLGLGTTYIPRDWSMYVNSTYGATSATVLTKAKLDAWFSKYITASADTWNNTTFRKIYKTDKNCVNSGRYESLIDNYSYYWLSSASGSDYVRYVNPLSRDVNGSNDLAFGVRVLVSLSSEVQLSDDATGTKTLKDPRNSSNSYTYNVWDIEIN